MLGVNEIGSTSREIIYLISNENLHKYYKKISNIYSLQYFRQWPAIVWYRYSVILIVFMLKFQLNWLHWNLHCVIYGFIIHHIHVVSRKHFDVIKWKHFPRYWPFVRGIHRSPVNSSPKGLWRGALMIPLIWVWINGWVNNGEAGDLRRYRAHYDVTVMCNILFPMDDVTRVLTHPSRVKHIYIGNLDHHRFR